MSQEPPQSKRGKLQTALGDLPVFPLPQVVLFPRARLPLHIFEARYKAMLKDALATDGFLVIARLCEPSPGTIGDPPMCRIAGVGAIVEHEILRDGRANIVLTGMHRVEMTELPFVPPYRRASAKILTETSTAVSTNDRSALVAAAHSFVAEVHKRDSSFRFHLPPSLEPGAIADLCAHHLIIDADARQTILEELNVSERVRLVTGELATQQQILGHSHDSRGPNGALN